MRRRPEHGHGVVRQSPQNRPAASFDSPMVNSSSSWSTTTTGVPRPTRGRCHRRVGVDARGEHRNGLPAAMEPRYEAGSHQRRLATTRRAGNHQDCGPLQAPQARRHLPVPPEERLGVTHVVGQESLVRAVPGHNSGLGGRDQLAVLTQDRRLQRHQLGPRFDAELFDERVPGPTERSQCICLASAPVLGQRQDRPPALPQRRLGRPDPAVGRDEPMLARRQLGFEHVLFHRKTELGQAGRLVPRRRPPLDVLERIAPPQPQRSAQCRRRSVRLTGRPQRSSPFDQVLEAADIDIVARQREPVTARCRGDRGLAQRFAQPNHTALHDLRPRRGRTLPPQRISQLIRPQDLAWPDGQRPEHDSVPRTHRR